MNKFFKTPFSIAKAVTTLSLVTLSSGYGYYRYREYKRSYLRELSEEVLLDIYSGNINHAAWQFARAIKTQQPIAPYFSEYKPLDEEKLIEIINLIEDEELDVADSTFKGYMCYQMKLQEIYYFVVAINQHVDGNYQVAIQSLTKVLHITRRDRLRGLAHYHLSVILTEMGEISRAQQHLLEAKYILFDVPLSLDIYSLRSTKIQYTEWQRIQKILPKDSPLSKEKKVTVYVWFPNLSILGELRGNPGHASIKSKQHYFSFWPHGDKTSSNRNSVFHTLLDDIYIERKLPDARVSFYSLDNECLNGEVSKIMSENYDWHVLSDLISSKQKSCSGLVMDLLIASGSQKLISKRESQLNDVLSGFLSGIFTGTLGGILAYHDIPIIESLIGKVGFGTFIMTALYIIYQQEKYQFRYVEPFSNTVSPRDVFKHIKKLKLAEEYKFLPRNQSLLGEKDKSNYIGDEDKLSNALSKRY